MMNFQIFLSRQVTDEMKEPYHSSSLANLRQTRFLTLFRHWDVEEMEDETVCPESGHLSHRSYCSQIGKPQHWIKLNLFYVNVPHNARSDLFICVRSLPYLPTMVSAKTPRHHETPANEL
jgi:hypothetical protein